MRIQLCCEIVLEGGIIWRSNLANLRRELSDEIGEANKLGLCQYYLGLDLEGVKFKSMWARTGI